MKNLNQYIYEVAEDKFLNEGLISWFKAFIRKIMNNQKKYVSDSGSVDMVDMDVNNISFQKNPMSIKDLDNYTLEFWADNKIGFPISANIVKNINKYSSDLGDIKSDPYFYEFFYKGDNILNAGIIIFEKDIQYKENYNHIISIETNLLVDNPTEVQDKIFKEYVKLIKKSNKSILGFTTKDIGIQKLKAVFNKLKFKETEDLEDIYELEIKRNLFGL